MTHLDLCSGIGGFHLAAEWAGFETVGFAEVESYCCKLLAQKWPKIKNYGDLRRADFSELRGRVNVLSAGVPCQPASVAGKRRGKKDDRWLWDAVLDVVGRVQPVWCIFENPLGILTLDEFGGILLRLESLGYQVRAFSVPANAVGAKHRRQRVFIVAYAGSRCAAGSNGRGEEIGRGPYAESGGTSQDAETLADADRQWELQQGRAECEFGQRAGDGSETLADGTSDGLEGGQQQNGPIQSGAIAQGGMEPAGGGQTLADADSAGRREHLRPEPVESQLSSIERDVRQSREFESGVRRVADDVPDRMDGVEMPSPLTTERIKDRASRLKALGNACVPFQVLPFFETIAQVELQRAREATR